MCYDSRESPPALEVKELLHKVREDRLYLFVDCDANFYHLSYVIRISGKGVRNFIMLEGLLLMDRSSEPTFIHYKRKEFLHTRIYMA